MSICPECSESYFGKSCPCGAGGKRDKSIPLVPGVCSVVGCGNDVSEKNTCVNTVVLRDSRGQTFSPAIAEKYVYQSGGKWYCNPGYEFVRHITRCNPCFNRERKKDWRDEMIEAEL
jgi:hypothetical protein